MIRRYLMKSIFDGNVVYLFVFGIDYASTKCSCIFDKMPNTVA